MVLSSVSNEFAPFLLDSYLSIRHQFCRIVVLFSQSHPQIFSYSSSLPTWRYQILMRWIVISSICISRINTTLFIGYLSYPDTFSLHSSVFYSVKSLNRIFWSSILFYWSRSWLDIHSPVCQPVGSNHQNQHSFYYSPIIPFFSTVYWEYDEPRISMYLVGCEWFHSPILWQVESSSSIKHSVSLLQQYLTRLNDFSCDVLFLSSLWDRTFVFALQTFLNSK